MSAKDFFLTELPPVIAQVKDKLGQRLPKVSYELEFEIEGEGMYSLVVKNGEASVRRGGAAEPLLSLVLATTTFEQMLRDVIRPRLAQLANIDPGAAEAAAQKEMVSLFQGREPVAIEEMIKHIKAMPLRLLVEVQPKESHSFELRAGGADEGCPTITVQLARDDLNALLGGKLAIEAAFKQQKLRLTGALSTGMALLSRLLVAH